MDVDGARLTDVRAEVVPESDRDTGVIRMVWGNGREITVSVYESALHPRTINVEIDGEMADGNPSMRIHMNDDLIYDTEEAAE